MGLGLHCGDTDTWKLTILSSRQVQEEDDDDKKRGLDKGPEKPVSPRQDSWSTKGRTGNAGG